MREFPLRLGTEGLRRDRRVSGNTGALVRCMRARPVGNVLAKVADPVNKWSDLGIEWPFPQLIRGNAVTLVADKTTIYEVDEDTFDLTPITTYNSFDQDEELSIAAGGAWHFVDCFDTWALFNGQTAVFQVYKGRMSGGSDKVLTTDFDVGGSSVATGCYFRGRIVLGGVSSLGFHMSRVLGILAGEHGGDIDVPGAGEAAPLGDNFVFWSNIGDGTLAITLFYPRFLLDYTSHPGDIDDVRGDHSQADAMRRLTQLMEREDWGFMPVGRGSVLRVMPLLDHVIIYTTDGVFALTQHNEPMPTFGLTPILEGVGIESRSAVGGNQYWHAFVDSGGRVWILRNNLELAKVGYREFFDGHSNIVGVFDHSEQVVRLSHASRSIVVDGDGRGGESGTAVTSASVIGGKLYGIGKSLSESGEMELEWDVFDMGFVGEKCITGVWAFYSGVTNARCSIHYSYNKDGEDVWEESEDFYFNENGYAKVDVAGEQFRLTIRCTPVVGEAPVIREPEVRWSSIDKRFVRGIYAGSSNVKAD